MNRRRAPVARTLRTFVVAAVIAGGCRSHREPPPGVLGWRTVASWSGHGNAQLETFPIERWNWRINWETLNEKPSGQGRFHVTVHSGDSGRLILDAIDVEGAARETTEVSEQPRRYYLVVESSNVDWTMSVEEPVLR